MPFTAKCFPHSNYQKGKSCRYSYPFSVSYSLDHSPSRILGQKNSNINKGLTLCHVTYHMMWVTVSHTYYREDHSSRLISGQQWNNFTETGWKSKLLLLDQCQRKALFFSIRFVTWIVGKMNSLEESQWSRVPLPFIIIKVCYVPFMLCMIIHPHWCVYSYTNRYWVLFSEFDWLSWTCGLLQWGEFIPYFMCWCGRLPLVFPSPSVLRCPLLSGSVTGHWWWWMQWKGCVHRQVTWPLKWVCLCGWFLLGNDLYLDSSGIAASMGWGNQTLSRHQQSW